MYKRTYHHNYCYYVFSVTKDIASYVVKWMLLCLLDAYIWHITFMPEVIQYVNIYDVRYVYVCPYYGLEHFLKINCRLLAMPQLCSIFVTPLFM